MRPRCVLVLALALPACAQEPPAPRLVTEAGNHRIELGGEQFAGYRSDLPSRPVVWPLLAPGGLAVTRAWPLQEEEGAATDHPHQKSLWFAHGAVGGVDFWAEGDKCGRVVQRALRRAAVVGDRVRIETAHHWLRPDGSVVCTDDRTLEFFAAGAMRGIDFTVAMHASHGELRFGDTKEGTMALRLPRGLCFEKKGETGTALDSEGRRDKDVWGKRARWMAYGGIVDGERVWVALLDHRDNLRHPTWWHARPYGLLAANPFGQHDFEKAPAGTGDHVLAADATLTFRYRVLVGTGAIDAATIEASWASFSPAPEEQKR